MSFHTWQQKLPLKAQINFDYMNITRKLETKFLDIHIYIYENIKWDVHTKCLISKLSKSYYITLSLKDIVSTYITSVFVFYTAFPDDARFNS